MLTFEAHTDVLVSPSAPRPPEPHFLAQPAAWDLAHGVCPGCTNGLPSAHERRRPGQSVERTSHRLGEASGCARRKLKALSQHHELSPALALPQAPAASPDPIWALLAAIPLTNVTFPSPAGHTASCGKSRAAPATGGPTPEGLLRWRLFWEACFGHPGTRNRAHATCLRPAIPRLRLRLPSQDDRSPLSTGDLFLTEPCLYSLTFPLHCKLCEGIGSDLFAHWCISGIVMGTECGLNK